MRPCFTGFGPENKGLQGVAMLPTWPWAQLDSNQRPFPYQGKGCSDWVNLPDGETWGTLVIAVRDERDIAAHSPLMMSLP